MAAVVEKDTLGELDEREQGLSVDIERLEGEVGGLRADVAGLVLDDPDGAKLKAAQEKLRRAAGRLQTAREDREHVQLARSEWGRRETARRALEQRVRRDVAVAKAHALQDDRDAAAKRVDEAFAQAAEALEDWFEACFEQRAQFNAAELDAVVLPPGLLVEGAFVRALRAAKVPFGRFGVFDQLPAVPAAHQRPLAEADFDMRRHSLPAEEVSDAA